MSPRYERRQRGGGGALLLLIAAAALVVAVLAISGVSNVGDLTHFRRNNGRDGIVIGNHVFY